MRDDKKTRGQDDLLTLHDVVHRYKRPSYWTWRRLVLSGALPAVRLPNTGSRSGILVRARDVERLISRSTEVGD